MTQYTQGPYETENDAPYIYATDKVVAKIFTNGVFLTDEERATRNLLAAAPELLEACIAMSNHYSGSLDYKPAYVALARAALVKINGNTEVNPSNSIDASNKGEQ